MLTWMKKKNKEKQNEPVFAGTGYRWEEGKYFGTDGLILPLFLIFLSLRAHEWHLTFTYLFFNIQSHICIWDICSLPVKTSALHAAGYTYSFCVGREIVYLCALWCDCHQCHFHLGVQLFMLSNALKLQTLIPSFAHSDAQICTQTQSRCWKASFASIF